MRSLSCTEYARIGRRQDLLCTAFFQFHKWNGLNCTYSSRLHTESNQSGIFCRLIDNQKVPFDVDSRLIGWQRDRSGTGNVGRCRTLDPGHNRCSLSEKVQDRPRIFH